MKIIQKIKETSILKSIIRERFTCLISTPNELSTSILRKCYSRPVGINLDVEKIITIVKLLDDTFA